MVNRKRSYPMAGGLLHFLPILAWAPIQCMDLETWLSERPSLIGGRYLSSKRRPASTFTLSVLVVSLASSAWAHTWWGNGTEVDQKTRNLCCGSNDCEEVSADDVIQPGADHRWRFKDSRYAIDMDRAMPSPDGRYWRCVWNGEIKCFFTPPRID